MKVKDIMERIRNVCWVMFHKDSGSKSMYVDELEAEDLEQEFSWFEVTAFKGKPCIEFNL